MEEKFPAQLFITREAIGTEDDFFSVSKTDTEALDSTKKIQVATYQLVEVREGCLEPVFSVLVG